MSRGTLFLMVGPSGAGKDRLIRADPATAAARLARGGSARGIPVIHLLNVGDLSTGQPSC